VRTLDMGGEVSLTQNGLTFYLKRAREHARGCLPVSARMGTRTHGLVIAKNMVGFPHREGNENENE
jgi:hypothetical protein